MARVDVSPKVLIWAAERSGKNNTIEEKFPKWSVWITEEAKPTLKQLEEVAKATFTPLGYFFLPEPPSINLSIPHFRTIGVDVPETLDPSPDLLESVETMERRQAWIREYLIEQGYDSLRFVGAKTLNHSPSEIAQEIRKELGLESGWASSCRRWEDALRMLIQKVDDARITVVVNGVVGNNTHRKLSVDEFRGFVLVDEYAPLIFINGTDGKAAQMFTLAHELAHIWLGSSAAFDLKALQPADERIEQHCNLVAAEFLVPAIELREIWSYAQSKTEPFQQVAQYFKVSEIVAARRALDLKLISRDIFFSFYRDYVSFEKAKKDNQDSGGGNFYSTQTFRIGRFFAETTIRATAEGKLLYSDAYRLTGLKGKTFTNFAKRLGMGVTYE